MKAIVFLLLLFNLLFYAYSEGYFGHTDNPDKGRVSKQISPERIKILSHGDPPVVSQKTEEVIESQSVPEPSPQVQQATSENEPRVCFAWTHISDANADKLNTFFASKFTDFKLTRRTVQGENSGWWVLIPPLPTKADADKKVGELQQLNVEEYFIIQDGVNRYAISLGIFSNEKGAQERLAKLREQGVRSARVMPRPGKDATVDMEARGPATLRTAVVNALGNLPKPSTRDCM